MSLVRVYLYGVGQKVIIPSVAETEEGFFVERAPVEIFAVEDLGRWKALAYQYLSRGNDLIATPESGASPGSCILEKLNLLKWADFEKNAVMYTIHRGPRFIRVFATGKNEAGTWSTGTKERIFEARAPLEVVVDEMAMELIKEPEAVPKPILMLGG
jgi:hypothetical protein